MIRNESGMNVKEEKLNEVDFSKVKLPATVNRFLGKFVHSMKDANLNRIKRSAILYKVINASGMSPQQLMADIAKIKRGMKQVVYTMKYKEFYGVKEKPKKVKRIKIPIQKKTVLDGIKKEMRQKKNSKTPHPPPHPTN